MSDAGILIATSIALFSTGHWIGGAVAIICAVGTSIKIRRY